MRPRPGSRSSPARSARRTTSVVDDLTRRASVRPSFAPPRVAREASALAERPCDDAQIAAARLAGRARTVVDAHLGDVPPVADPPGQELGGDHRALGRELQTLRGARADELERAVDVHDAEAERAAG